MGLKPEINQILDLVIDNLGVNAEGVARHQGYALFVPGALPGEKVRVKVVQAKKSFGRACVIDLVQKSVHRIDPGCEYYPRCGGCQVMHLKYEEQLKYKTHRTAEAISRIGSFRDAEILPCRASSNTFGYRNRVQLPVSGTSESISMGFFESGSHRVVDIESCPAQCELGNSILGKIKPLILKSGMAPWSEKAKRGDLKHVLIQTAVSTSEIMVILVMSRAEVKERYKLGKAIMQADSRIKSVVQNINDRYGQAILGPRYKVLSGRSHIIEEFCGMKFKLSPGVFFQVNPQVTQRLFEDVIRVMDLKGDESVVDAYCGAGALTLQVAQSVKKIIGIDNIKFAVKDAIENAKKNNIKNAEFRLGDASRALTKIDKADCIIVDPPRKGCAPAVLNEILRISPKRVIYISCDPATLARDLKILCQDSYKLKQVMPYDMFPQTAHVECVAVVVKR
jgi:23S rRNA (uracil1939-C5)-methyltransferase